MSPTNSAQLPKPGSSISIDLVGFLGLFITILLGSLYVTGWSYAHEYFLYFKLGIIETGLTSEDFLIFGFQVFYNNAVVLTLAGVFIASAMYFIRRIMKSDIFVFAYLICILSLTVFVFYGARYLGHRDADKYISELVNEEYLDFPRVKVWLKEDVGAASTTVAQRLPSGCFRLMLRNETGAYLIDPRKGEQSRQPVYFIPLSRIGVVLVMTEDLSCD